MGEIAADPVHERRLGGGLGTAHTGDAIYVAMYPFQDRHDPGDPVADAGEILRKARPGLDQSEALYVNAQIAGVTDLWIVPMRAREPGS